MSNKATFACPVCGGPAPSRGGGSLKTTTGRRRKRRCKACDRLMLTYQGYGEPEQFVRWVREASDAEQAHYARIRGALEKANAPSKYFEALARAGQRLAIQDLQASARVEFMGDLGVCARGVTRTRSRITKRKDDRINVSGQKFSQDFS